MKISRETESFNDYCAVLDLLNRYTDAVNRRDWQAVAKVFAVDGVWDVGGPSAGKYSFLATGREKVASTIRDAVSPFEFLVQTNHAPVIRIEGDRATASSTIEEMARLPGATEGNRVMGMYTDDITRDKDGEWRFARRRFRFIYFETVSFSGQFMGDPREGS